MKIIVGLGNPGLEYQRTRHNIGYAILDRLSDQWNMGFKKSRLKADLCLHDEGRKKVLLVKPLTFMNLSGESVGRVLRYYKRTCSDLLVVHDDLDLNLGRIKFSESSSSGGHNGVQSIIEAVGTKDFHRLRFGIDRVHKKDETIEYVLNPFDDGERKVVEEAILKATEAIKFYLQNDFKMTMNFFN